MNSIDNKLVAIHQPNFFPWLGYFNKYVRSDIFIIADSVQHPKSHGGLTNRVSLILDYEKKYLTIPIKRSFSGVARIKDIQIIKDNEWLRKTEKQLETNYKKAPFFSEVFPVILEILEFESDNLCEFNLFSIRTLLKNLDICSEKIVMQSSLELDHLWKTEINEYIIEMVRKVGGNAYLSGDGSAGYQNEELFRRKSVDIYYTRYNHPVYNQFNATKFVSGLSIIDALMNVGLEGVNKMILTLDIL